MYYPMLVSQDGTAKGMSPEENTLVWKTYLTLSQLNQDILTDSQMPRQIIRLQDQFGLSEQVVIYVSLFIRKIFFGELSLEQAEAKIGSILMTTSGNPNQAQAIVEFIRKEIMTIKPGPQVEEDVEEKKTKVAIVNLPLLQALSKYEQLGSQLITQERIKIKSQTEPVRPSLIYWIKYYRDELGVGQHSSVQRGNFLFRSENGKRLSIEERERVNLILKSIEENFPLSIDTEKKEILFPEFALPRAASPSTRASLPREDFPQAPERKEMFASGIPSAKPERYEKAWNPNHDGELGIGKTVQSGGLRGTPVTMPAGAGEITFSSKHVLPAEKDVLLSKQVLTQPVAPQAGTSSVQAASPTPSRPRMSQVSPNPFHIRPVSSLIKEEEEQPDTRIEE